MLSHLPTLLSSPSLLLHSSSPEIPCLGDGQQLDLTHRLQFANLSSIGLIWGPRSLYFQWILQVTEMHKHVNNSATHWGQPLNSLQNKDRARIWRNYIRETEWGFSDHFPPQWHLLIHYNYTQYILTETKTMPGMVAHACNSSTWEARAGGRLQVQGQPGLMV